MTDATADVDVLIVGAGLDTGLVTVGTDGGDPITRRAVELASGPFTVRLFGPSFDAYADRDVEVVVGGPDLGAVEITDLGPAAGDIADDPGRVRLVAVGFGQVATAVNNAAVALDPAAPLLPGHSTDAA